MQGLEAARLLNGIDRKGSARIVVLGMCMAAAAEYVCLFQSGG